MNRSLAEGAIPFDWNHASVTPINKAGYTTDAANYRTIPTLPVFAKFLERVVHITVYTCLRDNRLLFIYQSGYRPLHSRSTCLIDVTNKLLHHIDRGLLTGMVFLDLSKAFDTLDHDTMSKKLYLLTIWLFGLGCLLV